jgi:hypothetical protein
VRSSLSQPEYDLLWDQRVGEFAKAHMSKDAFVANMSIGRPLLGKLISYSTVSREHATHDAITDFDGDMHAITLHSNTMLANSINAS